MNREIIETVAVRSKLVEQGTKEIKDVVKERRYLLTVLPSSLLFSKLEIKIIAAI